MEEMKLKVFPLSEMTDEEFAPYGEIIGREKGVSKKTPGYEYWPENIDFGPNPELVVSGLFQINKESKKGKGLERHADISESFFPIEGKSLFILAPPDNSKSKPDTTKFKAVYLDGRLGISLKKGTWHWPTLLGDERARYVIVRKGKIGQLREKKELKDLNIKDINLLIE